MQFDTIMGSKKFCLFLLFFVWAGSCLNGISAQNHVLKKELEAYVCSCDAEIGIAVITDRQDTICVNNGRPYPMNSVLKLYQALAVAEVLQRRGIALDSCISIKREELHPKTYSPLREKYPSEDFSLSIGDLLKYALQESDNNACDLLFDRIIGMGDTEEYIRKLGVENFAIRVNERDMFENHEASSENWNYPLSAAIVIDKLFTRTLFQSVYQDFLKRTLVECRTGQNRLPKPLLQTGATIGHKTGTGFDSPAGLPQGINDVGFVTLPTGRHYAIAVFVKSSQGDMAATEQMIADISDIVYRYMTKH